MMMSKSLVCLAFLASLVYASNAYAIEKGSDFQIAINKFAKLVEKHHLNVSIIATENKYHSNGEIKEATSFTFHLPANDVVLHKPTLNKENTQSFLKSVKQLNKHADVAGKIKFVSIVDGEDKVKFTENSNDSLVIDSFNHDLLTNFKDGERGFLLIQPSNEILYNYNVVGDDGKNETVKVVTAHLEINLIHKSDDLSDDVVKAIEKILPKIYLSTDDNTLFAHRLVTALDKEFNSENYQVMMDVPDDFYVSSDKWALFDVLGTNVLIFSFSQ